MSDDLLGGAMRGKTRPRGFIEWQPRKATVELLEQVRPSKPRVL